MRLPRRRRTRRSHVCVSRALTWLRFDQHEHRSNRSPTDRTRGTRSQPRVNTAHVENVFAVGKQPRRFFIFQIAQANRAFQNRGRGIIVVLRIGLSFEDEGGEGGDDGAVEAGVVVVAGGVVGDGEGEAVDGGVTAGAAAEVEASIEMEAEDGEEDDG